MFSLCGYSKHNNQATFFQALIFDTIKFKNNGKTYKHSN